jgi:hypothetical protein
MFLGRAIVDNLRCLFVYTSTREAINNVWFSTKKDLIPFYCALLIFLLYAFVRVMSPVYVWCMYVCCVTS